ncbi:redoxin domain-containing protein [Nonomuraea sp. CA-218870]|uniref:redoxin domain-containing protein n=1 Tax=Nonomuraea sp. CA-218870 TaxID=3239998 RepID=UPI003D8D2CB3
MNRAGMAVVITAATLTLTACGAAAPGDAPADPMESASTAPADPMKSTDPMNSADPMKSGDPMESADPMKSGDPMESASPDGGAAVPQALRFSARTLDGQAFEGGSLAGKPVVFWFWAPWCTKCRADAPAVKAAADTHKDVAFVGVAGLDAEAAMKEFVRGTGTDGLVHLSDEKGAVWTRLGVSQQSVFVFMKPGGETAKVTGPLGRDGLDAEIAKIKSG